MNKSTHFKSNPSICFVALNAYNILSGRGDINHTGGAEVQQLLIAKWLVEKGYAVSFLTLDHNQSDDIEIDGIRILKAYRKESGISGLRFIYPRWYGLWNAMQRADSDIYYQRCAGIETGQVALWCRIHHKKFIFAAANESDCENSLYALHSMREKFLYRYGLKHADTVITQTITQQIKLSENMNVKSVIIPNCALDMKGSIQEKQISSDEKNSLRVLWIGRISEQKRFEWLLGIAEECSEIIFDIVGAANADSDYSKALMERVVKIPNVKMHGFVPYTDMLKYYQQCDILCCTSAYEGFPNIFLEAWSFGMPVVSTFDPDGVIAANGLGWVENNIMGIATCLRELAKLPDNFHKASIAARQYYLANHIPDVCLLKFENILEQLYAPK